MLPHSVQGLSASSIRKAAGLSERAKIDCVFGGPPCQGFSMIGKRVLEDPRNSLVLEFVRLVSELDSRTFVFENVKGLTVGRHREFLDELVEAFDREGYRVRLPWQVLDAADYGVPQHRERLILVGAKKGIDLPSYPTPRTIPSDRELLPLTGLLPGPTCRDALADLPDADLYASLAESDFVQVSKFARPDNAYARELRCLDDSAWHYGYVRAWDPKVLTSSARTSHSEISRRRFEATQPGAVEPISRFFRLPPGGLSNTLRAGTDGARGAFTSPRPIHFEHPRCITVREMARLHGYPDWFRFHVTKWHGARQVGNSVAPPLGRAIASEVMKALGAIQTRPEHSISLGDPALLSLDLTEAALRFGVTAPSSRRDRKSGARKRKQHETEAARLAALRQSSPLALEANALPRSSSKVSSWIIGPRALKSLSSIGTTSRRSAKSSTYPCPTT